MCFSYFVFVFFFFFFYESALYSFFFFFSSRRRHTRFSRDWSSDVCSSDLTAQLKQPAWRWLLVVTRATLALFEGRLDEAETLIDDALALGRRAQASDAILSYRVQVFSLRLHRGGLEEVEETLRSSIIEYPARPMFRCMLAYLLAVSGREAE